MGTQRYSILYSSKTGNTKKLAEKIREVLPEENCDYFGTEGAKRFAEATAANLQKPIYIIYNGEVISAPTVQAAITDGACVINNMESYESADNLATTIRIGALPLELKELQSNIVGAKLGEDAIHTSLLAGLIGLAVVAVIMILVYRFPGVVSVFSLIGYTVLMVLCLNLFDVTLTLPGIAGILLSIGMAVDANVIIFTRIKEEITAGKSVKMAVKAGFQKAMSAILDGNITTLIAAAVLWFMASGSVKGFAQTLALGIILSMFTALVVTRLLLNAFLELGAEDPKLYGRIPERKPGNYVKNGRICFVISAIIIITGLVFLPINKNNENIGQMLNFSMEFMGGTSMTVEFDQSYTLEQESENGARMEGIYFEVEAFMENIKAWFGEAEWDQMMKGWLNKVALDIAYYPSINEYNGIRAMQIVIKSYLPHTLDFSRESPYTDTNEERR